MARVQHVHMTFAHLLSATRGPDRVYFLRTILLGGAFLLSSLLTKAAKCTQKLFYSKKMVEFAYSELNLASQPRYLTLVSMGAPPPAGGLGVTCFHIAR